MNVLQIGSLIIFIVVVLLVFGSIINHYKNKL